MSTRTVIAAAMLALTIVAAACGSSSSSSPTATTASGASVGAGVDPNTPEVVEPGDIPDDQVFLTMEAPDGSFTLQVPEGWARTEHDGVVTFTDKYNSVTFESKPASRPPSVDTVTSSGLADVSTDPTFTLGNVAPVTRRAGDGILATYEIGSAPNAVTARQALLAVERYEFFHNGATVVLTLSGAKGADNVDPWRIVSDSLAWT